MANNKIFNKNSKITMVSKEPKIPEITNNDILSKLEELEDKTSKEIEKLAIDLQVTQQRYSKNSIVLKSIKEDIIDIRKKDDILSYIKSIVFKSEKNIKNNINNIKIPEVQKTKNDYLKKDDFEFIINDKFKEFEDIKELKDDIEIVPAKLNSIEAIIKDKSKKEIKNSKIPKEEKSIIELANLMRDGVEQFEIISKEYISKIKDFEELEDKSKKEKLIEKEKNNKYNEGLKQGEINFIRKYLDKFPSNYKDIDSEYLEIEDTKEFIVTEDNKEKLYTKIDGEIKVNIKYKTISPTILLDNKVIIKSKVEVIELDKI